MTAHRITLSEDNSTPRARMSVGESAKAFGRVRPMLDERSGAGCRLLGLWLVIIGALVVAGGAFL